MDSLNVGIDSWIIQDGNYEDFSVGQTAEFALEFYPRSMKASDCKSPSVTHLIASRYQICGQVLYQTEDVWVLDMGFLAYKEMEPPSYAKTGSWVEGEFYLGIDPFMYFEYLKNRPGMPSLTYRFRIDQIFLNTTPWIETPGQVTVRDEKNESYREVSKTNAWGDDNGNAGYILKCVSTDGRIRVVNVSQKEKH